MPRARKHFKVLCSIATHRKTAPEVYPDNDLFATYVRIGIAAIENYADHTGDSFLCSGMDLMKFTGCSQIAAASKRLSRLVVAGVLELSREGVAWRLRIPNLARKQGFSHAESAPSASAPASAPKKKTKRRVAARSTEAPERLDEAGTERVRGWIRDVIPSRLPEADAMIEDALDFLRARGKPSADWPGSVVLNIRNRINASRRRDGESPLPSQAQARADREACERLEAAAPAAPPPVLIDVSKMMNRAPSAGGVLGAR